jgi:phosphopantothenoylcysteine decarboxylase/phosphopantothenate--cysteine ligase
MQLELERTPDILAEMGKRKKNQLLVGFALESDNELQNAEKKLKQKNLDLVILNSMRDEGAGFKVDTNRITVLSRPGSVTTFDLKPKQEVANDIVSEIEKLLHD